MASLGEQKTAQPGSTEIQPKEIFRQMLFWKSHGVKIDGMSLENMPEEFQDHFVVVKAVSAPESKLSAEEEAKDHKKLLNGKLEEARKTRSKIVKAEAEIKALQEKLDMQRQNLDQLRELWRESFRQAQTHAAALNEALGAQLHEEASMATANTHAAEDSAGRDSDTDVKKEDADMESKEEQVVWKRFQDNIVDFVAKRAKTGDSDDNGGEEIRKALQATMDDVMGNIQAMAHGKGSGKGSGKARFDPYGGASGQDADLSSERTAATAAAKAEAAQIQQQVAAEKEAGERLLADATSGVAAAAQALG